MTKKEYEQVVDIIDQYMTVIQDSSTAKPKIVLSMYGFHQVKRELQKLVKGDN